MKDYLFLYGTLLPDQASGKAANIVTQLRLIGRATARGTLYDFGEYPGAVLEPSSETVIHGKVFELPGDRSLSALDRYEEFERRTPENSLFVRKRTMVKLQNGRLVKAWIYLYNRDPGNAPVVMSGKYSRSKIA